MAGLHGDELGQLSDTARKVIRRNHRPGTSGCSLSFVHIRHHMQNQPEYTKVKAILTVNNTLMNTEKGQLMFTVAEKENPSRIIARKDLKNVILQKGENTITMDLNCPNAKLWNPDSPHLYVCRVELKSAKRIWDADSRTFGFRWFEPTGIGKDAQLRLNGQRVMLLTAISWGYWPVGGLYATPEMAEKQNLQPRL